MKKIVLAIGIAFLAVNFMSCTKNDCQCTYYDAAGNVVPSYSYDYEEMVVSDCSDLSTITEGEGKAGFICQ